MIVSATPDPANPVFLPPQVANFFTSGDIDPGASESVGSASKLVITGGNDAFESPLTQVPPALSTFPQSMAAASAGPTISDVATSRSADTGAPPSPRSALPDPLYL